MLIFTGLLLAGVCGATVANLVLLDKQQYPQARCIDGSSAGFYLSPATSLANATKWVIFLQGGGECVTEADCANRAKTNLGSSTAYPSTRKLLGFQGSSSGNNPDFGTYNHVFLMYCSGDLWTGKGQNASSTGLYYAGHAIVEGVVNYLKTSHNLLKAEFVLWSGESAGGIGSLVNLDFFAHTLPDQTRVLGAPIGGWYFSNEWPYLGPDPKPISYTPWTYADVLGYTMFWDSFLPEACTSAHAQTPWMCLFAQTSYATLTTPIFVIEAQTDKVVMPLHNGLPSVWDNVPPLCDNTVVGCPQSIVDYMKSWHTHMEDSLVQLVKAAKLSPKRAGLFHPACLIHTTFEVAYPIISGLNYIEATGKWVFGRGGVPYVYVDNCVDSGVMCGKCK